MVLNLDDWQAITDVGDAAIMLPVAAVVITWLALGRAWKAALLCGAVVVGGMGLVMVSKLGYVVWGLGLPRFNFFVISGHAMLATLVLMLTSHFLAGKAPRAVRWPVVLLAMCTGALVALSRVMVKAHPMSEVVVGFVLGALLGLLIIRCATAIRPSRLLPWHLGVALLPVVMLTYGQQMPSNRLIIELARKIVAL
jgi:membrane-associated phospholipid phosphatase